VRTANPALGEKTFTEFQGVAERSMTVEGTVVKTSVLLTLLVIAAGFTWIPAATNPALAQGMAMAGALAGLVFAFITIFRPTAAPFTAPLYAVCEGLFLGGISAAFEARFPGIVVQAVLLTFGTLGALLMAYTSGLIRATENFKLGVVSATGAIFLVYLVSFVGNFFGWNVPFIHDSGLFGIAFSGFVVVIAALNLVLDFDFIESGAAHGAPKHMEWYGAFGLLVTLVWLYIEILRLLAKLQSRD
jgi:uncharacterized YccA/Bax inhibitor family protein